jgi:hypothetical protein
MRRTIAYREVDTKSFFGDFKFVGRISVCKEAKDHAKVDNGLRLIDETEEYKCRQVDQTWSCNFDKPAISTACIPRLILDIVETIAWACLTVISKPVPKG